MAISKSTPYVRYKKDFTSSLHLGTIHVESEYLDRTQKTTIESIHGMTWHNKVVNENKELNLLSDTQLELTELEKQYWNTGEKRVSVDEIHTLEEVEPNEDGTYTYTVNSMEGEYIEIYDGINNITSTSDGLDGQFEIVYDTTEEDVNGNIALDQVVSQYEITDSGVGVITGAKSTGLTLVNHITESSKEEVVAIGEYEGKHFTIENTVQGNIKSAILKGQTLVNLAPKFNKTFTPNGGWILIGTSANGFVGGKKYLIIPTVTGISFDIQTTNNLSISAITKKSVFTYPIDGNGGVHYYCNAPTMETEITPEFVVLEYQEGMENWDIPYFEGMQSVKMPVLTTVGKNIFNKKGLILKTNARIQNNTGNYAWSTAASAFADYFDCHHLQGKQITLTSIATTNETGEIAFYTKDKTFIKGQYLYKHYSTATVPTNAYYYRFSINVLNTSVDDANIQIEESSTATPYEPYKSNILTTNEEVELRGIGDVQDELDLITGELTQRVGEVVLDGSEDEDWYTDGSTTLNVRFKTWFLGSVGDSIVIADKVASGDWNAYNGANGNEILYLDLKNGLHLSVLKTKAQTVDELKLYLQSNPLTVQYQLVTESVKTVDLTVQNQDGNTIPHIQTQQGITHVSTSSDGLTPIVEMSCSYDTIIKPNTTYTIKLDRPNVSDTMYLQVDLGGTMMMLDADVNAFTIKTPSTLSHSQLRLSGTGNTVKEIIVLEGNRVNDKIEYFEGMKNVENPILVVSNCPYVFGKGEGVTFKKYQTTTLSLNEPIQLRSIGDVHDEINYETGEYIQRIGEIVFDGSEDWSFEEAKNGWQHYVSTVEDMVDIYDYQNPNRTHCDKLVYDVFDVKNSGSYLRVNNQIAIYNNEIVKDVKQFKQWLSQNPIILQYQLAQPIITKIDTTILDQNNSYKSSQQTYDEQTYVSVQSDTVVTPTSSIDYEIYSSTGTVTGTSATIENAEAGTPVSGVVYGETLLNVIQEPSEDEYVIIGEAFEEQSGTLENTVECNIKSAILKGQTLVNFVQNVQHTDGISNVNLTEGRLTWTAQWGEWDWLKLYFVVYGKPNSKYIIKYQSIGENVAIFCRPETTDPHSKWVETVSASNQIIYTYDVGTFVISLENAIASSDLWIQDFMIIEYQEGMENWDIPYFEDMQSVQMPVLTTTGKNLFDVNKFKNVGIDEHGYYYPTKFVDYGDYVTLKLKPNTRYTVTGTYISEGTASLIYRIENNETYRSLNTDFNTDATGVVNIRFGSNSYDFSNVGKAEKIMIVESTFNNIYEPFKSNILTVNEDVTLRSNGDVYDELNLLTGRLTQRIDENNEVLSQEVVKTVDISIVDQDDKPTDNLHTFDTTTHINTYAQGGGLIPFVSIPETISYDTLLKTNTQYTVKLNRTNIIEGTPLTVNLGGTELSIEDSTDSFTITTPSTLTNNTLSIGGFGNRIKEVMIIEGDCVNRDLDFFEGFVHVENPILYIEGTNIANKQNHTVYCNIGSITNHIKGSAIMYNIKVKPNTRYTLKYECEGIPTIHSLKILTFKDKIENCSTHMDLYTNEHRIHEHGVFSGGTFDTTKNDKFIALSLGNFNAITSRIAIKNIQIVETSMITDEILPCQNNTLATYPQVTLRSIGDIKDEWDVVGETVTKYIGEVVLDGSQDMGSDGTLIYCYLPYSVHNNISRNDKLPSITVNDILDGKIGVTPQNRGDGSRIYINIDEITTVEEMKNYLAKNPIKIQVRLTTPITKSVRITPPNPQTSTASITIPTQLDHVKDTSDFLVWNPYKEHYVRYNYVEDGVVLDNYTWENLTDLNERQFVQFYNRRTYIDQPYHNYVASHDSKGTSKYVLIEPNQDYTVTVRFSELPTCETVKVNLGGTEVEMNVNDPYVHITTPNTLVNNLCSISGDGLDGKVTDILVIHCLEHEGFADIDYFEGTDGIGEIVEVDGVPKSKIVMEQTNGNLLDFEPTVFNNGNYISMGWNENHRNIPLKPNTSYRLKMRKSKYVDSNNGWGNVECKLYTSELVNTRNVGINTTTGVTKFATIDNEKYLRFCKQQSQTGNTNIHEPLELTYAHFTDNESIRPRYYDKEEILLPMQLHRINTVYDNFYYDEMKGYYRIQQSIGHKYFVGADSENWTLIEKEQRVLRFRYNNADIQMKSLGEFMTNILPNGTTTSPYECCAFSGSTFIVSIDKERLSSESLTAFKEWLANNNLHLYYQLASPLMIDLPQYPNRIEFNTYKDEIYTFFKNCKPTVFTLAVPLDQTYRFYEFEQSEGYANRVELTDERMTEEDTSYINTIYGSGIGNLIEEPNNVDTMLKPNYEGKATSHSLVNGKVSTIGVHGFEPNDVTISNYNTVTKQYELTVQAQQGTNTNTETLAVPYKLEIYEDGTKDRVYYNSQYKQWMFEGRQTLTVPYNASTGAFTNVVEVFRGLQPRSGLIGEFKVRFTSGTTSARLYYSINGTAYGYTTLRDMTDGVDYYIGFFNTGGSKIDMGTKIDANAEYTKLVPINGTIPECLMINQIQSITECTYYQDKTYYYSDVVSPLVLDVYNGTTTITELNGAVIDIQNNAHNKQALIYGDTTYTVYWTYIGGEGNIKVTLGGTTQEVVATQGYVTITTSDTDLERGLFIGGFNVTIKDLMLVKGERITDLKYFEGSRAVGTAFTNENGETMYKITLVTGSELINDKFEEIITFEDNKKHNVVVTKLLGAKPDKI